MKIKSILTLAAAGLMLAACQNQDRPVADGAALKGASAADSLVYFFGQMRGAEYQRDAKKDSLMLSDDYQRAYIKGVQAGMNAIKDDDAYNQGLFLGIQMARNFDQFQKDYNIKLDKKIFIESLMAAMANDSIGGAQDMQREFYRLMGQFNDEKAERDRAEARVNLDQEAKKLNLPKISDDLYGTITEKTEGAQFADGNPVELDIKLNATDGSEVRAPFPSKTKIGARNMPTPVTDALLKMKDGETGKFATTAQALFGQRCSQMRIEPSQVVIATIKAKTISEDDLNQSRGPRGGSRPMPMEHPAAPGK